MEESDERFRAAREEFQQTRDELLRSMHQLQFMAALVLAGMAFMLWLLVGGLLGPVP